MERYINPNVISVIMTSWRTQVDPAIRNHLEIQIREATKNRKAILQAENAANAQLWCAIANLSKQNFNLELRLKYLEKLLGDLLKSKTKSKKKQKEIDKILKSLQKY